MSVPLDILVWRQQPREPPQSLERVLQVPSSAANLVVVLESKAGCGNNSLCLVVGRSCTSPLLPGLSLLFCCC